MQFSRKQARRLPAEHRPAILPRREGHTVWCWILVFLLPFSIAGNASAQSGHDEYQVKAAFVYNFVKFVEWPGAAAPGDMVNIGIVGNGPSADAIEAFCKGKSIEGRPLATRRLKWDDDLRGLRVVFVAESDSRKVQRIVEVARTTAALTVGDATKFAERGGIINFLMENGKVRFEVNTEAASQAGLKISSKLLSLAKSVTGRQGAGAR